MRTTNRKNFGGMIAASMILIILLVGVFTPTGRAAISRLIDMFEQEKQIATEVEGEIEITDQHIQIGVTQEATADTTPAPNTMAYIIYIDESSYSFTSENGVDTIKPINFPENYPEVYMEIYQVTDKSKEQMAQQLMDEVQSEYETVYDMEEVTIPFAATHILAHDGVNNGDKETLPQWDSKVVKYYIADNTQGGAFVIKMRFFMEAEEGHGSRMLAMLKEFVIVPVE